MDGLPAPMRQEVFVLHKAIKECRHAKRQLDKIKFGQTALIKQKAMAADDYGLIQEEKWLPDLTIPLRTWDLLHMMVPQSHFCDWIFMSAENV